MMTESERELYQLHANQPVYKKHKKQAIELVKNALIAQKGTWVVSYSGGKDSTVLLDLCVKAGWKGPLLYIYYSKYENPEENLKMIEWATKHYGLELHQVDAPGEIYTYRQIGHFFILPSTDEERKAVAKTNREYKGAVNKYVKKQDWIGQFIGMRIDESGQRKQTLGCRGPLYFAKTRGTWTCCPIYRWSGKDIWAYIVENDLPYEPVYDLEGEDRERLRNEPTFFVTEAIWRYGAAQVVKRHHAKLFNELAAEFPEIRQFL